MMSMESSKGCWGVNNIGKPLAERLGDSAYRYAAKVSVLLTDDIDLAVDQRVSILALPDRQILMEKALFQPMGPESHLHRFWLTVEPFTTAAAAEQAGVLLMNLVSWNHGSVHGSENETARERRGPKPEKSMKTNHLQDSRGGTRTRDPGIMSAV